MTSLPLSPREAASELLRRRKARGDLTEWVRACGYEPAAHHRLIIRELERAASEPDSRVMLLLPPGSAKSTYASILFPPWYLARSAGRSIIAASHTQELAERFGRKARNLVDEHGTTLGYGVAADSKAAGRWETDAGGEYFAAGVGGAITGRRADLAIIDDPIRSREDADSQTVRDRQWDWWMSDLRTRLKPGASVILIQTRWHEDDLAGRLLASEPDRWRVIKLPMIAGVGDPLGREPGAPLWPEWFTDEMRRAAMADARVWSALYQQEPSPEEGNFFRSDWFRSGSPPPISHLRVYGASDYAVTADGGDFTVHAVVGLDPDERLWLLDVWRRQAASDEWIEAFCDLVQRWKPIGWAEEQGQIRAGVGPFLERRMRERRAFVARTQFPTRGDKAVRSQSIRGRMALSGLYIEPGHAWRSDVISECLRFPTAKHDDVVDALGLCGQLLDKMTAGIAPIIPAVSRPPMDYRAPMMGAYTGRV